MKTHRFLLSVSVAISALGTSGCAALSLFGQTHTHTHHHNECEDKLNEIEQRLNSLERSTLNVPPPVEYQFQN